MTSKLDIILRYHSKRQGDACEDREDKTTSAIFIE